MNKVTDRAIIASRRGHGCVLYYSGTRIEYAIDEVCMHQLSDLGLDDAPDGLSVWEGTYSVDLSGETMEPDGEFRDLDGFEWLDIVNGVDPFGDVDA